MEELTMQIVSLEKYRPSGSTSFVGRPQGEEVRKDIGLSELDKTDEEITIIIPENTTSFNPSFFLGLLYNSIKYLGGVQNFKKKYKINIASKNQVIINALTKNLNDGFRNANNSIEGKSGLDIF